MQIHLSVNNFRINNIGERNNASLIALLHKQPFLTDIVHGDKQSLHRPYKLFLLYRLHQIVVCLHFKGLEHHLSQDRYKNEESPKIPAAQFPRRLHAVYPVHLDIEKENIYAAVVS